MIHAAFSGKCAGKCAFSVRALCNNQSLCSWLSVEHVANIVLNERATLINGLENVSSSAEVVVSSPQHQDLYCVVLKGSFPFLCLEFFGILSSETIFNIVWDYFLF